MEDARKVRAQFCQSRPATVVSVCGNTCTVSLKMHLNQFVATPADPDWLRLGPETFTCHQNRVISPNVDGLQRGEGLMSGDGNVLGGASGGDVPVKGSEPRFVPPCPEAGPGYSF